MHDIPVKSIPGGRYGNKGCDGRGNESGTAWCYGTVNDKSADCGTISGYEFPGRAGTSKRDRTAEFQDCHLFWRESILPGMAAEEKSERRVGALCAFYSGGRRFNGLEDIGGTIQWTNSRSRFE